MSDDLRERTPVEDQGNNPADEGTRSDVGASDGAAPGMQAGAVRTQDPANNAEPLTGQGTASAGGYGTGSDRGSSGGSEERTDGAGSDVGSETEWLRSAADPAE